MPPRIRTLRGMAVSSRPQRWLSIVGIGEDGVDGLSPIARRLVSDAELVLGVEAASRAGGPASIMNQPGSIVAEPRSANVLPEIEKHRGRPVTVLASGDPFHYGVGDMLMRSFSPEETLLRAAGRAPSAWRRRGSAGPCRRCRRSACMAVRLEGIVRYLQPGARILGAVVGRRKTPAKLAVLLQARGFDASSITRCSNAWSGPNERADGRTAAGSGLLVIAARSKHSIPSRWRWSARRRPHSASRPASTTACSSTTASSPSATCAPRGHGFCAGTTTG